MTAWQITGTDTQQAIVRQAFERIKFPFELLTIPGTPELGWRDLNGPGGLERARQHGDNHHGQDKPDSLEGEMNGRRWVMGVIYPQSGRIYLDLKLEAYPEMAAATLGAEIAHAVDFFLPMTDPMREELLRLWDKPGTTWWEVADYGSEYYRLGGEAFMHEFVTAYSDIDFGSVSDFTHNLGVEPADVFRILGIERTDYVAPVEAKPKVVPVAYIRFGKSKVYHRPNHALKGRAAQPISDITGMRPCKQCKPGLRSAQ